MQRYFNLLHIDLNTCMDESAETHLFSCFNQNHFNGCKINQFYKHVKTMALLIPELKSSKLPLVLISAQKQCRSFMNGFPCPSSCVKPRITKSNAERGMGDMGVKIYHDISGIYLR